MRRCAVRARWTGSFSSTFSALVGVSPTDLGATIAELRAAGVAVTDPVAESWGTYVQVTDPEGREFVVNDRV